MPPSRSASASSAAPIASSPAPTSSPVSSPIRSVPSEPIVRSSAVRLDCPAVPTCVTSRASQPRSAPTGSRSTRPGSAGSTAAGCPRSARAGGRAGRAAPRRARPRRPPAPRAARARGGARRPGRRGPGRGPPRSRPGPSGRTARVGGRCSSSTVTLSPSTARVSPCARICQPNDPPGRHPAVASSRSSETATEPRWASTAGCRTSWSCWAPRNPTAGRPGGRQVDREDLADQRERGTTGRRRRGAARDAAGAPSRRPERAWCHAASWSSGPPAAAMVTTHGSVAAPVPETASPRPTSSAISRSRWVQASPSSSTSRWYVADRAGRVRDEPGQVEVVRPAGQARLRGSRGPRARRGRDRGEPAPDVGPERLVDGVHHEVRSRPPRRCPRSSGRAGRTAWCRACRRAARASGRASCRPTRAPPGASRP